MSPAMGTKAYDEETLGPMVLAVMWLFTGLASICVFTRLYIRLHVLRNPGPDDWIIMLSIVMGWMYCALTTKAVELGYGRHTASIPIEEAQTALKWNEAAFVFGIVSFVLPKLAVAALLDRLLLPRTLNRCIIWGLVGGLAAVGIVNIFLYVTMCDPIQALWKFTMVATGEATCRDIWILINYATFTSALSVFVDCYLAVFPSFVLFSLKMSLRKKIGLSVTMGLGFCAAGVVVVKCIQLKSLANLSDSTYSTVSLAIWTSIEANMVVIASCIPCLRPLLDFITTGTWHTKSSESQDPSTWYGTKRSRIATSISKRPEAADCDSQKNFIIRRTTDVEIQFEMQSSVAPTHRQYCEFGFI
ncbi:uncharacterized protein BDW47DRAFT_123424 [Aspergillus candidus]|uniref:Rhodopsin domain-containing protein n=1 Tax=Aspergillus candidus TaxID=41067 RepID=A0A2I2FIE9_ASPCN|nr:hypothetical protein BDW47DRAFT_123424 [Aspergillus candidus]PLB40402.1 hypothetical protein BDW47DRAFT_123424 [Aspergillus candidus]